MIAFRSRLIFTGLLCGLLLTGCDKPKLSPLSSDATIVAFGDSLTYGIGADQENSYPSALADLTGMTVVNAGISGEITAQGVVRFQSVLDKYQPQLVILLEGGNDILRNQELSQVKNNLASMIKSAQSQDIQVILLGVPEKKLFSDSAALYGELANQYNLVFDGEILSELLRSAQYKSDPIHLNEAGYRLLAEKIYTLMLDHGALQ